MIDAVGAGSNVTYGSINIQVHAPKPISFSSSVDASQDFVVNAGTDEDLNESE